MFLHQKHTSFPKSTQKIIKFADADTNLKQLGSPVASNTGKRIPKCYIDPKLCKCKSKTGHFKVWNSIGDTQKLQNSTITTKNDDSKKKPKDKKHNKVNTEVEQNVDKNAAKLRKNKKRKKMGDSCDIDQCKELLQYIRNAQSPGQKNARKTNIGFGDQILTKIDTNKVNDLTKILKNTMDSCCIRKSAMKSNPLMEIKVDSNKMQVMNPIEIKSKVKQLGAVKKNEVCVCPSRKKRSKLNICQDGACAKAAKSNQGNFQCTCAKKNIECNDLACKNQSSVPDCLQGNIIANLLKKICSFKNIADNLPKHLFEVTLDSANMNVVNSAELKDIFKNASNKGVCPNGVCRKGLDGSANVNCRCINKKLARNAIQCNRKTCNLKKRKEAEEKRKKLKATFATHANFFGNGTSNGKKTKKKKGKKGKNKKQLKKQLKKLTFRRDVSLVDNLKECPQRTKEDYKQAYKREMKYYKKEEKKTRKATRKALEDIERQRKREIGQWNCVSNCLNGIINLLVEILKIMVTTTFTLCTNPVRCYVYLKQKFKKPHLITTHISQWFRKTWGRKNSKVSKMMQESEAISIISDQIENMPFYDNVFANKGKTKEEQVAYERKKRMREKRMQQRHDEALFGCRNILLTTLRKTPCICFYYLCPNLYPQCLSLLTFLKNFIHIIIYLAALAFWTPCIFTFEACRSLLCCLFCAG